MYHLLEFAAQSGITGGFIWMISKQEKQVANLVNLNKSYRTLIPRVTKDIQEFRANVKQLINKRLKSTASNPIRQDLEDDVKYIVNIEGGGAKEMKETRDKELEILALQEIMEGQDTELANELAIELTKTKEAITTIVGWYEQFMFISNIGGIRGADLFLGEFPGTSKVKEFSRDATYYGEINFYVNHFSSSKKDTVTSSEKRIHAFDGGGSLYRWLGETYLPLRDQFDSVRVELKKLSGFGWPVWQQFKAAYYLFIFRQYILEKEWIIDLQSDQKEPPLSPTSPTTPLSPKSPLSAKSESNLSPHRRPTEYKPEAVKPIKYEKKNITHIQTRL